MAAFSMKTRSEWLRAGLLAALASLTIVGSAYAQRAITVNGHWLTPEQAMLADYNAGFHLPNGHYYCDPQTGLWGPLGSSPMGQVHPSQCPPPAASGGDGAYVDRGPFGTMGSDGSCSYYNDPETGASVMTGNC
jgi:hypothetical protein